MTIRGIKNFIGKFGACLASDPINTNKTKSLIEEDIGTISLDDYSTTNDASKALYNQEIDDLTY